MNKAFSKIVLFVFVAIALFVYLGNSVPQVSTEQAGAGNLDYSKMSQDEFVKAGEKIVMGKGTCYICHTIGDHNATRAPDLNNVGARIEARAQEPENRGRLKNGVDYLVESLHEPSAYVVKDFSPIMPKIFKPPIALSRMEIKAVIAFLQSRGGKVTVTPQTVLDTSRWDTEIARAEKGEVEEIKGHPQLGAELFFNQMKCVACHKVNGSGGVLGPDLTAIGAINTVDYLKDSILDPNKVVVKGYKPNVMPRFFKNHLSDADLDNLVAFLMTLKGETH